MLNRVFHGRKKGPFNKSRKGNEASGSGSLSRSFQAEEEEAFGHMNDLLLTFCGGVSFRGLGLRELLQSSVQVLGESGLGISEKVVLRDGEVFAAKRFRRVSISKGEFARRVERLAHVSAKCEYLVPLHAYLYAKRTKLVLCPYYPMGSLADLLSGARELGHTPLDWNMRFMIIFHVAKAIRFIHTIYPAQVKDLQMNVHGNIKSSNVLVKTDFSICLSDYGFFQLAKRPKSLMARPQKKPEITDLVEDQLSQRWERSQKCDILNYGMMMLDILGGSTAPFRIGCIKGRMDEIREGRAMFFEFYAEERAKKQALQVLEIALACSDASPEARPSIDQVFEKLTCVLSMQ